MRKWFTDFTLPSFSLHRKVTTYQADYNDAAEMVHTAVALRIQGCQVRMCAESRRLFVTVPWKNRLNMRFDSVRGAR